MGTVSFTDFPSSDIIDAINKTIYSVVPGNSNFNLGGIFWEKDSSGGQEVLKLASTDNNRLNVATLAAGGLDEFVMAEGSPGFIISRKSLSELKSLAEGEDRVALGVGASCLVAKTKNSLMIMRHLSGQFPKYQALIPTEEGWVITVSRKDFIESLKRVSLLSAEKSRIVYFAIHDGGMIMSIANKAVGQAEEKITISYTGPDINIGFDPKHLLASLNSLKSERVSIRIINNKNPAVGTGEADPGYLGIITTVTPREEA